MRALIRFLVLFGVLVTQLAWASVWVANDSSIYRLDWGANQIPLSVEQAGTMDLVVDPRDDSLWGLTSKEIIKRNASGAALFSFDLKAIGLNTARFLALDPRDGSIWVGEGKSAAQGSAGSLLRLSVDGTVLGTLPSPGNVRGMSVALDRSVWILGDKRLVRYSPEGGKGADIDLKPYVQGETKLLSVDSIDIWIWVAAESRLIKIDAANPSAAPISLSLPKSADSLALDTQLGWLWVLAGKELLAFETNGVKKAAIDLDGLGIKGAVAIAFDPVSQSLLVAHTDGVTRFSADGVVQQSFQVGKGLSKIGVPPFEILTTLEMAFPAPDALINDSTPELVIRLKTQCSGNPCEFSGDSHSRYVLSVEMNGQQFGPQFKIDPATAQARLQLLSPLPEGMTTVVASATDLFGRKSDAVTANFTVDTIPPRFLTITPAEGSILGYPNVLISGTVDDSQARVVLSGQANHAITSEANFNFPVILALGINTFKLSASDQASNTSIVDLHLSYVPDIPISIGIDTPAAGATVSGDNILVSGTFQGPSNTGITVNGIVASQNGAHYYATVPLSPGQNTLTAIATRPDGATATQTVAINSSGVSPFSVSVELASGIAPLNTTFLVRNNTGNQISKIQIDFDGDGTVDFTTTDPGGKIKASYVTPGVYLARVMVTDSLNNVHTISPIIAIQDITKMDAMLRGVYMGMLSRLREGNIDAALAYVTSGVHEKYKAVFNALKSTLVTRVDQLGEIQDGSINDEMAEYVIVRNTASGPQAFLIYFILGEDGVWRIDGM